MKTTFPILSLILFSFGNIKGQTSIGISAGSAYSTSNSAFGPTYSAALKHNIGKRINISYTSTYAISKTHSKFGTLPLPSLLTEEIWTSSERNINALGLEFLFRPGSTIVPYLTSNIGLWNQKWSHRKTIDRRDDPSLPYYDEKNSYEVYKSVYLGIGGGIKFNVSKRIIIDLNTQIGFAHFDQFDFDQFIPIAESISLSVGVHYNFHLGKTNNNYGKRRYR